MSKEKLLAFILLLFVSCNSTAPPNSSKEKLNKEKMVEVLLDVHLFEATFNVIDRNNKDAKTDIAKEYALIFKKHNVQADDFFSTFNFYIEHPALLDSTYRELVTRITTLQSQSQKQPELDIPIDTAVYKDSLRNQMMRRFKAHKKIM